MGERTYGGRALVDANYWFALGNNVDRLEDRLNPRLRKLAARYPLARSVLTAWVGRRYGLIVADWGAPGQGLPLWTTLLAGRRRLLYLNFHTPLPARTFRWFWWVQAPLLRLAVRGVQALSLHDCRLYADQLGLGWERVRYVPYPWRRGRDSAAHRSPRAGRRVMASGYARCDWETLFSAAVGASWDLVVVCGSADLDRVQALNQEVRADLLCDIPSEEHAGLLEAANVYVIPVREEGVSAGHVRLRSANEYGAAVVSADIRAMREYLLDGITALTYRPGDSASLRVAVDRLLDNPEFANGVARAAMDRSANWDQVHAFIAQGAVVDVLLGHAPEPGLVHPPIEDAIHHAGLDPGGLVPLDAPADRVG